ncbi:MAG: AraC family transcriptional regulator [Clostridia bacterium]|nr:AraC family transcriptional regulator [Clostridia bacterium]
MTRTTGVFRLPNGTWGFRYAYWINGKQKDIKRTKDENNNPFKTERAAIKARESAILKAHTELSTPPKRKRVTVSEVYTEYCATGRCGKAYGTTRKQDSLGCFDASHLVRIFSAETGVTPSEYRNKRN